jgi:hypothetical protein
MERDPGPRRRSSVNRMVTIVGIVALVIPFLHEAGLLVRYAVSTKPSSPLSSR